MDKFGQVSGQGGGRQRGILENPCGFRNLKSRMRDLGIWETHVHGSINH